MQRKQPRDIPVPAEHVGALRALREALDALFGLTDPGSVMYAARPLHLSAVNRYGKSLRGALEAAEAALVECVSHTPVARSSRRQRNAPAA